MKTIIYGVLITLVLHFNVVAQQWETVGTQGYTAAGAQYPDLAMYNGVPYVAFKDASNGEKCTVMKYIGSSWVIVGAAGFSAGIARDQSIAIDASNGDVYVAYSDAENGNKTTVMKFNGSAWELVGNAGFSAMASYQSLVIDNGTPYVAFEEYYAKLMKFNGTAWEYVGGSLPASVDQVWYTKLAMHNNVPYVVYRDIFNGSKTTVVHIGTNDTWEPLGTPAFSAGDSKFQSIAIDDDGIVYVAYQDMVNGGKATVKKYSNSSWVSVGTEGFTVGTAVTPNIKIDAGIVYLSFRDESEGNKITVLKFDGQDWLPLGTVGVSVGEAYSPKLAFENGIPYLSYADVSLGNRATLKKFVSASNASVYEQNLISISVYPNPAQTFISIESNEKIENVQIHDLTGKMVKVGESGNISISDLISGVYFVNVSTVKGTVRTRFIKE